MTWKATNEDKELLLGNCDKLNAVAEVARTMGTTLWFDKTDEDKLRQSLPPASLPLATICSST